ncbi:hypothetical protein DAPPUDRAFT_116463 [Daphnia pulex]|uniref:Uncharacterized protein n=1 Tax=Daphnia pulex TaxID=6669 RepID=E9HPG6_DAPPU|nr:hypothetical protein DAPPUDRAFT_116463 [Daphnia pulex]|eukprot:EFX66367.1 hypothetical protein DAPPUDRAFT_116463 [Daphnia pulex]
MSNNLRLKTAVASTPLKPFAGVDSSLERVEERIDGEENGKDKLGEDQEEEGGWDPVVDGIGGSQIWFEEDEEEDCHEECNGESDDEETVLLDQTEEGRGI